MSPEPTGWRLRLAALVTAAAVVTVFLVAIRLEPDRRGYGTHQQLGLPACQFLSWTGWPCPHCGMTTSFSHLVRGQFSAAVRAHPCGPLLAGCLVGILLPWCLLTVVNGRSVMAERPASLLVNSGIAWVVIVSGVWLIRLSVL